MNDIDVKHAQLQDFKDPFNKESVDAMHFHCMKSTFNGEVRYSASIEFKNGNTKGAQSFNAESFPELVKRVEQFVENL